MSPFDPDAINYTYRALWLSTKYEEMKFMYSYLRFVAAAETGLLRPIENDDGRDYDFEENYIDAIRYCQDLVNPSIY